MPTYNRFDYLVLVINKLNEQSKGLKFKIAIVNDASNDSRYDTLTNIYDNIIYEKNDVNYGKDKYYLTVNKLLNIANNNKANKYIFLADDSLPSINLIKIVDKYIENGAKVINIAIHKKELYTNWGFDNWVDGGLAITHDTYIKINQKLENIVKVGYGTGVYREITIRLNKNNIKVHFPKYSLLEHMGHTESVMHPNIRLKEKIFSYSFVDNMNTTDVFRDETLNLINQKIQLKVSDSVCFFKDKMTKKYNTVEYTSTTNPTVFFGMYSEKDYRAALNHKGQKIIVWCGTDALKLKEKVNLWSELRKMVNIAMSSFVKESLNYCGIESEIIPITPTDSIVNVKPKGKSIYWYYNSEGKRDFYGGKIVNQIKKLTNYSIIEAKYDSYKEEELNKIYENCFLGLRLTEHDGLSNTVVEMGLMGRYCIHNGDTPNSIKYNPNNINEIIEKINKQYENINEIDYDIAKKVNNYMFMGNNLNKLFFSYDTVVNDSKLNIINNNYKLKKEPNLNNIKKKSSDGTSNGNAVEVKKTEPPKTIVINNKKAILPNAEKLHKPNNPISKIGDDALLAKIRRRNTGFGGRR
jgi:hypothetical protein